nr:hypothetical protein CFP56_34824 [Quercus suber]
MEIRPSGSSIPRTDSTWNQVMVDESYDRHCSPGARYRMLQSSKPVARVTPVIGISVHFCGKFMFYGCAADTPMSYEAAGVGESAVCGKESCKWRARSYI